MLIAKPIAICALLLITSCDKQHTFDVTVAPGYKGAVSLSCSSTVDGDAQASVGAAGGGSATCPKNKANLRVHRDGREVTPADVVWMTTGDGIVSGLKFTVR